MLLASSRGHGIITLCMELGSAGGGRQQLRSQATAGVSANERPFRRPSVETAANQQLGRHWTLAEMRPTVENR